MADDRHFPSMRDGWLVGWIWAGALVAAAGGHFLVSLVERCPQLILAGEAARRVGD